MPKTRLSELLTMTDRSPREEEELANEVKNLEGMLWDMEELVNAIKSSGFVFQQGRVTTGKRNVTFDKDGIQLASGTSVPNQISWMAGIGGNEIGRIFTTVVGSSPDRYGLVIVRGEPEAGSTNAASQGSVSIRGYDHDGSADDQLRGSIQVGAGTAQVYIYNTSASQVGLTSWTQTEMVVNDGLQDYDFRVEGDTVDDVFKVDAGLDQILAGTTIAIKERAASQADTANYGQLWVKNDDPNILRYTDGDGTEFIVDMTAV